MKINLYTPVSREGIIVNALFGNILPSTFLGEHAFSHIFQFKAPHRP